MKRLMFLLIIAAVLLSACAGSNGSGGGGGGSDGGDDEWELEGEIPAEAQDFAEKVGQSDEERPPDSIAIPGNDLYPVWRDGMNSMYPGLVPDTKPEMEDKLSGWGYRRTHPGNPDGFDTWELTDIAMSFFEGLAEGSRQAIYGFLWAIAPGAPPIPVP